MKKVLLWDVEGVVAVILSNSDVVYGNQCGGTACVQEEAEGILVPFNNDPPLNNPNEKLSSQLSDLLLDVNGLSTDLADKIDDFFQKDFTTRCARVDREKLSESREAWVYIKILDSKESNFSGFGNCDAVLTWHNSD